MLTRTAVVKATVPVVGLLLVTACSAGAARLSGTGRLTAVATISAWGSILAQLGGPRVHTVSIITSPGTDPHDYEPTPADARAMASAGLFVENGVGYDAWADRLLAANPVSGRTVINVGALVGVPEGGNPHCWYSPSDVDTVAVAIRDALERLDPADAAYFIRRYQSFTTSGLADYHRLIDQIASTYPGVPVGASESIFVPLADALRLHVSTPSSFLQAISEGTDPSSADTATIDGQIRHHTIKVYVFNSQNSTPDVAAQVTAAKHAGIPVTAMTETLSPASASFQEWQVGQLRALEAALHQATGR